VKAPGRDDARPPAVEPEGDPYVEAATPAAFASWLRGQREVRGLSRAEVAHATKLAPPVIEGLESGEPARMPSRAYLHGYLKAYAGALGLDADEVILRWQEVELAGAPAEGEPEPAPRGTGSRLPLVAAAGALVAVAAAAAAWLLR
jgi:cytoskeletal protein RodZ